ncbi:MAG: hypothetical protein WKF43_17320, partial [Acidimicrobiales bacterium]
MVLLLVGVVLGGLWLVRSNGGASDDVAEGRPLVAEAASPIGLVALPSGGFRYGERRSGAVREVDSRDRLVP